jgi:hypothetical protein
MSLALCTRQLITAKPQTYVLKIRVVGQNFACRIEILGSAADYNSASTRQQYNHSFNMGQSLSR